MAFQDPREIYAHALRHHYALGAFNVCSIESILAVMQAAQSQQAPVVVQVSMGARAYVRDLPAFVIALRAFAKGFDVPMFLQHDHCTSEKACVQAMDAGVQAVMFDGSHLPYEENVRQTARVAEIAHKRGVWVEAELGCLPGFEDLVFSKSAVYTDPEAVPRFIEATRCDALAVAVGTSHGGVQGSDYLPLDLGRLRQIIAKCPGYPFVLHGAASLVPEKIDACNRQGGRVPYLRNCSEENIAAAVCAGIKKANMDVDNFLMFTTAARQFLNTHPELYDPRKYLAAGRDAFQAEVEHKLRDVMGSAGKAKL